MPLSILDKQIASISGPVTYSLLSPDMEKFNQYKSTFRLPFIMLFGDIHNSDLYQCDTCSCDLASKQCCYAVYSREFLELLDRLASPIHPVDFYMEGFMSLRERKMYLESVSTYYTHAQKNLYEIFVEKQKQLTEPLEKLREEINTCYIRELRGTKTFETFCPAKNIRWHKIDARFSSANLKYTYESIDGFLFVIDNIVKENKLLAQSEAVLNFETKIKQFQETEHYSEMFQNQYINEMINLALLMLNYDNPDLFINYYFSLDNPNFVYNSIIYKQIRKMTAPFNDFNIWKKWFGEYYKYILSEEIAKMRASSPSALILTRWKNLFKTFLKDLQDKNYKKIVENTSHDQNMSFIVFFALLGSINTLFLDFYYITRTFKKPEGAREGFLSIGYFGAYHVENLNYFFTNIMKLYNTNFNVKVKDRKNASLRCLSMPDFNFNDLMTQYGLVFSNTNVYPPVTTTSTQIATQSSGVTRIYFHNLIL